MTGIGTLDPWPCHARAWLAAIVCGCSGFEGGDDRLPALTMEQGALGMAGSGTMPAASPTVADWSCLGSPAATNPNIAAGSGNVMYAVAVRSLLGAAVANVVAKVCLPADTVCATPLSEVRGLNADGLLVAQVPVGFNGFLEVQVDGHVPTLFHMRKPIVRDTSDPLPLTPIPAAGVVQLAGLLNTEVVPELGIIAAGVVDCRGERAPGATFSNNLGGRLFYFIDGLPNLSASSTDPQGLGGFANVPLRLQEVSAIVESDGRLIGTRALLPRAGWLTAIQVRPAALPLD